MSVSDEIRRIQNAKANIKTSIENKGVTVPDDAKLDTFPSLIDDIQAGGSGETHTNPDFYELRTNYGTNFDHLFRNYSGPDINVSKWNTSKVTSAQYCFSYCTKSINISNWDLSSLTNASYMFESFKNGNKYIDLSALDFSNVTNVDHMFSGSNTNYLDVRNIKLPKATNYDYLFSSCSGTELDLSSWDISNVTRLGYGFYWSNHKKIDLTGWNTNKVTYMYSMFYYCTYLETLLIPDWDMTNATNTSDFLYYVPKLKYIDLSRSNDLTIKKIASFLPTKTATTYGEAVIPADTSQDVIDALAAKYWKPVGPKFDLTSVELALELDEIKPGKTTKVWTGNNDPWYGDDRPETIEFISSNESIATINGREITSTGVEGTVEITCRRREDGVVISTTPITLTVSETDSNPNLIKFRTNGREGTSSIIKVNETYLKASNLTYNTISGIYSYDPGKQITSINMSTSYSSNTGYITEIIKLNFDEVNITSMYCMFSCYQGVTLDLRDLNTVNVTTVEHAFKSSPNLVDIIGELDFSNLTSGFSTGSYWNFYDCPKLETIYLKNIYKNSTMTDHSNWSINLSGTKVKDECLIYIINELPDLINDKGLTSISYINLYLPKTNTLSAEQVQPAIDKGWIVLNTKF